MASKVPTDPNLSPEIQRFLDAQARANDTLSSDLIDVVATIPALASSAEAIAGVEDTHYMSAAKTAAAIVAQTTVPIFTKAYSSAAQAITAAGSLTLAHSLGATPSLITLMMVNQTTDAGYSPGDLYPLPPSAAGVFPDATNIGVRFTNVGNIAILHKTTGVSTNITFADWKLIVSAWA